MTYGFKSHYSHQREVPAGRNVSVNIAETFYLLFPDKNLFSYTNTRIIVRKSFYRLGLRTIELLGREDSGSRRFEICGRRIFARGLVKN